jgi:peptide/nickel transport system permease protein
VLRLEYVTHARAKGAAGMARARPPRAAERLRADLDADRPRARHLLGGIAVIETVFTLPGLGRLLVDSIFARDYPVVQGCLLFTPWSTCWST